MMKESEGSMEIIQEFGPYRLVKYNAEYLGVEYVDESIGMTLLVTCDPVQAANHFLKVVTSR